MSNLWVAQTDNDKYAVGRGDKEIAIFENRDDAKLFRAAEEMLEALEFAQRHFKDRYGVNYKRINEAIAKAKGEL